LMEHGYHQRDAVTKLLVACGFNNIADHQDDAGLSRVVTAQQ